MTKEMYEFFKEGSKGQIEFLGMCDIGNDEGYSTVYLYLYHNKICVNSIISKFDEDLNLHDSYKDYIIEDKNELNKIFKDKYFKYLITNVDQLFPYETVKIDGRDIITFPNTDIEDIYLGDCFFDFTEYSDSRNKDFIDEVSYRDFIHFIQSKMK